MTMTIPKPATLDARMVRAIERRFGRSMLPYTFRDVSPTVRRITDPETGSWLEATWGPFGRITVLAEHDGAS